MCFMNLVLMYKPGMFGSDPNQNDLDIGASSWYQSLWLSGLIQGQSLLGHLNCSWIVTWILLGSQAFILTHALDFQSWNLDNKIISKKKKNPTNEQTNKKTPQKNKETIIGKLNARLPKSWNPYIYLLTACMVLNCQSHFHRNKIIKTENVEGKILVLFFRITVSLCLMLVVLGGA